MCDTLGCLLRRMWARAMRRNTYRLRYGHSPVDHYYTLRTSRDWDSVAFRQRRENTGD